MMYGRLFKTMYDGSMVGKGFAAFAVMGFVIANQQPSADGEFWVRLNTTNLSSVFGEPEKKIEEAIKFLCSPDPKSTTPAEEGRRLAQITNFDYRVVNGAHYARIVNEEKRREQFRVAQTKYRAEAKLKRRKGPGSSESAYIKGDIPLPNSPAGTPSANELEGAGGAKN